MPEAVVMDRGWVGTLAQSLLIPFSAFKLILSPAFSVCRTLHSPGSGPGAVSFFLVTGSACLGGWGYLRQGVLRQSDMPCSLKQPRVISVDRPQASTERSAN